MDSFHVGAVECSVLLDGNITLPIEAIFPQDLGGERPDITLDAQGQCILPINCLLAKSAGKILLVDTGNGAKPNRKRPGGGQLLIALADAGVDPAEVDVVVLTHMHSDHCGGATILKAGRLVPTFPRAHYMIPKADWEYFTMPERINQMRVVYEDLLPLVEGGQLHFFEGEIPITEGARILSTPGHTPGHSVVLISSEEQSLIVVGDLFHHRVQIKRPDLVRSGEIFPDVVLASRRRIIELGLSLRAQLLMAHETYPVLV